jgi:hypothetical protein
MIDHQASHFGSMRLAGKANLAALADLSGAWIDRVHAQAADDDRA